MASIILRDNPASGSIPLASDLMVGELVSNTTDGRLFSKNVNGSVITFGNTSTTVSSSYALTSSYALNGGGGSISASYALTSSYASIAQNVLGSITSASYAVTSSYTSLAQVATLATTATTATSASYALTSSYASLAQVATLANLATTATSATTATTATSSSYALTSSYASLAQVATLATTATSASYATTATSASYALNGGGVAFPFNGDAVISGSLVVTGSVTATVFNSTSDRNQKDNIVTIPDAIIIVKQLTGVQFIWKASQLPSVGLIAQDVEVVLPELVTNTPAGLVLNYTGIIGVLVEAVKTLTQRVEELERV